MTQLSTAASFAPVAIATGQTVSLSMQRLWLTGQVLPAGARLVAQHVFRSQEEKPLEVVYAFPLPRDAALRRFRITGEGFEAHSELQETEAAVKAYEEGIARGSLSTLARQYGDGIVNLTIGNIQPRETVTVYLEIVCGVELRDDGFRFRFPFTLAPSYHAQARTAVTEEGEGEMELPSTEFGDMLLPRFRADASLLHQVGFDLSLVSQLPFDEIASPSHAVRVRQDGGASAHIALAAAKDVPNRDLVLDARFKSVAPQVLVRGTSFAAVVPSDSFGANPEAPRRVVILLDRSGSMRGEPLTQARNAIEACLGALSETDSFGLIAFDNQTVAFQPELAPGTRQMRDRAHDFLMQVEARGGTELAAGFLEAAKLLSGGGDILILTDGQVSGTEKILADARAVGVRLHCLGIGSASQDRFLSLLARETGGVSRFVTPRERVDLAAVDLFASIGRPVAAGLKAGPNIQPAPPSCVFAGTPVLLFGESREEPAGIELTWEGGQLRLPVTPGETDIAETVRLLQGARLITDWESRYPASEALAPLEKRQQSRVSARLRELSQTYGLASREMSLVAVVTRATDRAGELPETRVVPVGMPQDTPFGAYFPRMAMAAPGHSAFRNIFGSVASMQPAMASRFEEAALHTMTFNKAPQPLPPSMGRSGLLERLRLTGKPPADTPPNSGEILVQLAARMESDGGMPGANPEARACATILALFAFLSEGHALKSGAFRSHVARLVQFLTSQNQLPGSRQSTVAAALEIAHKGIAPRGPWLPLSQRPRVAWKEIDASLQEQRHK